MSYAVQRGIACSRLGLIVLTSAGFTLARLLPVPPSSSSECWFSGPPWRDGIRRRGVQRSCRPTISPSRIEQSPGFCRNCRAASPVIGPTIGHAEAPKEVAALVVYLLSDECSYSTGAEFVIHAGMTCGKSVPLW